jgi:peptidoglycan hydrolase CwlO-like protein
MNTGAGMEKLVCEVNGIAKILREHFDGGDSRSLLRIEGKLNDLQNSVNNIMSKLSDFLTAQEAFNDTQSAAIDSVSASVSGLQGDVKSLNDKITELQNSTGAVTPEDQARIDAIQAKGVDLNTKLTNAAAALKALDDATPPVVP